MSDWPALEELLGRSARERYGRRVAKRRAVRLIPAVAAAALLVGTGIGLRSVIAGVPGANEERPATATMSPVPTATAGPIGPLGVLNLPRNAATKVPPRLASQIADTGGAQPSRGRKALTTASGVGIFVMPARHETVCLAKTAVGGTTIGGVSCSPQDQISAGTFAGATCVGRGYLLYGLLPNDVNSVTLTFADGGSRRASVINNVWAFEGRGGAAPLTIEWTARSKQAHASAPVSPPCMN